MTVFVRIPFSEWSGDSFEFSKKLLIRIAAENKPQGRPASLSLVIVEKVLPHTV